jgi:hypothetical protein
MTIFFRKIQKKLRPESKLSKYLLYKIEEIALIVIGILIALSINNWNDKRKKKILEREILTEIQANLKTDLEDHQQNIRFLENRLKGSVELLENLTSAPQFYDSIAPKICFIASAAPHINPVFTGYNKMLSSDPEVISCDSIRSQISLIYENHYKWLSNIFNEMFLTQTASLTQLILKNFIIKESDSLFPYYEPKNFRDLKRNTFFLTSLETHMKHWEMIELRYKDYIKEIEKVIQNIEIKITKKMPPLTQKPQALAHTTDPNA